ncbi:MAG: tRNA epoxyqueuosine(34) reductase QueG [Deltaproteobacteria bacterium]|nr:tRNA epoxyqueuosine(34) reductase QueG [Deltaproteobacteria bacterium]
MSPSAPLEPRETVRRKALALGFHRVGVARAEALAVDHPRYLSWLARGLPPGLGYLAENVHTRARVDTPEVLEGARSVVVCALSYHRGDEPGPEGIARYARGRDYHNFLRKRLRRLAAFLRVTFGAEARPVVDTAPVLERAWARLAGVGFVGKNGCVIAPGLGSYLLLGEVVTTLELPPDEPLEERCGACTRCLDACPSGAFRAPWVLDPSRCVSYLTIEHRGPIAPALREPLGPWLFGCDACQEVCPFNRTAPPSRHSTRDFAPLPRWKDHPPEALLSLTEDTFRALTEGTALVRAGREGLCRNAALVLGNTGSRRHLPVLARAHASDPSPVVREAAGDALARLAARLALAPEEL